MHPDRSRRHPSRRLRPLALVVIAAAAIGCSVGGGEVSSIGFGTGGNLCDLTGVATTYPAGSTVAFAARYEPLPHSVTVNVTRDGEQYYGPDTVALDGSVPCIHGYFKDLEPGRYEVVVTNPESQMPPLAGDFDVNP